MAATAMAVAQSHSLFDLPDINSRSLLEVELPSVNGTGTACALAAVYGDLATGGEGLGINAATILELERPKAASMDQIFGIESAFRCGFMGYSLPTDPREIALREAVISCTS